MRAWFNMPTPEFVDQLRDIAIKAGARPQVIDCLDAIIDAPSEDEIEKLQEDSFQKGEAEGRSGCAHEWRLARKQVLRDLDDADIGLTETQIARVLETIDRMEPEA